MLTGRAALLPASMPGEPAPRRKSPASGAAKSGSADELPVPV
jgi:hypothetical protein